MSSRSGLSLDPATRPTAPSIAPTPRMLRAALSGLMAAGAVGCSDDSDTGAAASSTQDLTAEQLKAMCADMVAEAKQEATKAESKPSASVENAKDSCEAPDVDALCKDKIADAKKMCPKPEQPDVKVFCADAVKEADAKARAPIAPEDKVTNAEQKEYTYAALTKLCDSRGGYVQVHASCGGVNTCKGFSYGDWGPGAAMLTEHSCSGANGCAGLSCVETPKDMRTDKKGADLYDLKFADTEPGSCTNCHAPYVDEKPQLDKFVVFVNEGSTRTTANWLDRTVAEQERVVAFGAHSVLADGTAMQNMSAYHKVLSRAEIERLVAHIRTLTPVVKVMKSKDPTMPTMPTM